jgi:hypothetical protein
VPSLAALSEASQAAAKFGLLTYFESQQPVLEINFEGSTATRFDLRPVLPLIFIGVP